MAIWEWALEAYARPGAPAQCLRLQDQFGQNTSLLLWAVWAEASEPALMARAADLARRWDETALLPLRAVRRALKPAFRDVGDGAREGLRDDVKGAELHAERVLLEALAELSGGQPNGAHALDALKAASAAWNPSAPDVELAALAAALG